MTILSIIKRRIQREPALIAAAVAVAVQVIVALGVDVDVEAIAGIGAALTALAGLWVRQQVTPAVPDVDLEVEAEMYAGIDHQPDDEDDA